MDLDVWMDIYSEIVRDLGLSEDEDRKASIEFSELLSHNTMIDIDQQVLRELRELVNGRDCLIFGTSMDLESAIMIRFNEMEYWVKDDQKVLIAADGAASILLSLDIVPDIIVTDLDGGLEDQLTCSRMGSILVVHAHGDNMDAVRKMVPRSSGKVLGSTQVRLDRIKNLYNFGGFTDGDRAVMLADEMGAGSITLLGFDFEKPGDKVLDGGGRKQDHTQYDRKKNKLNWAKRIIEMAKSDVKFL